jgi:two-component system, OmpR family, sensor histidine kinase SenX3
MRVQARCCCHAEGRDEQETEGRREVTAAVLLDRGVRLAVDRGVVRGVGAELAHGLAHGLTAQIAPVAGLAGVSDGLTVPQVIGIGAAIFVVGVTVALLIGRHSGRRAISQRLTALGSRLGIETPDEHSNLENALSYLEQVTGAATEAVADSSADAIRLRRSLDTFPQGVILCDENATVVYRNARANALMTSRHGDALAAQAVTELLEEAWDAGAAERTLDLYGPPRRTLTVRARLIDDGRRPLGVIAIIEDVSERRRLEEIRRDFVANVSHELKTPMGALGLLAETLVAEPDVEVARRLANRIHTEAFRVSRIIDDLLDLSRIESEEAPPREPVLVNLVMAEAVERVRASAEQRHITINMDEPEPPVVVLGDRRQLVSAMHALIENAVTYSYDGSTVTVEARVTPATLEPAGTSWGGGSSGPTRSAPPVVGVAPVASTVIVAPGVATTTHPSSVFSPPPPPPAPTSASEAGDGDGEAVTEHRRTKELTPPGDGGQPHGPNGDTNGPTGQAPGATSAADLAEAPTTPAAAPAPNGASALTRTSRKNVRISVVDHGVGIPARDLDRIFERFYRVDHGRSRETGGTGLGLSIVRHVANNHQGWVEVESREGEGSTFTLVLPLQPDRNS